MVGGRQREQSSSRPPFDNTNSVIVWALLTAGALAVLTRCGLRTVAAAFGGAVLAAGLALLFSNWAWNSPEWTGRKAPDRRYVIAALTACLVVPGVVFIVMVVSGGSTPRGGQLWVPRAALLATAVATSAIFLSGLVDWSYTTPRRRGTREGHRPCTASTNEAWRALTRNWLLHRMISYTIVRLAAGAAIGIVLVGIFPDQPQPISSVLAAAAALLAAYVLGRVTPVAALSQNPALRVGDAVILAEEFGTGVDKRPMYYVVDVAVEGVQLRELDDGKPAGAQERSHDRTLEIKDVNRLLRVRTRFTGCSQGCSRVNKYCPLERGDATPEPPLLT
jgi:hypothetical protein